MSVDLRTFCRDRSGNFALSFAILGIPVLMAAGLAVDYINLSRERRALQNASDAAALAVAREGKLDQAAAEALAGKLVAANYPALPATVSVTLGVNQVQVDAVISEPISFGGVLGIKAADVSTRSVATYASARYEIVFVLDTTGSMAGGKLTSMQQAVTGMIDDMSALKLPAGQIKYGVVPYAGFVNVGAAYGPVIDANGYVKPAAAWIDQDSKADVTSTDLPVGFSRFALFDRLGQKWRGCVETRQASSGGDHDVDDTVPNVKDPHSLFTPMFAIDEPDNGGGYAYPNSYLADAGNGADPSSRSENAKQKRLARYGRNGAYAAPSGIADAVAKARKWNKVAVDTSPSRFYSNEADPKGPNYGCEVAELKPLTTDTSSVKAMVNGLVANGSTNTLEGVMWGWRVLSSREPFTQGAPKTDKGVHKIMIFLTDGANSFGVLNANKFGSGYTSYGYLVDGRLNGVTTVSAAATRAEIDAKTLSACANAKADDIEIYTIRLEEPDKATGDLLQKCASSPGHFYDAPTRAQLSTIFEGIQKDVMRVRLSS